MDIIKKTRSTQRLAVHAAEQPACKPNARRHSSKQLFYATNKQIAKYIDMNKRLNCLFVLFLMSGNIFGQYDSNMNIWIDDLEIALSEPERVFNLDLSNSGLESIPEYLNRFPNLQSLKLSDNNIDSLNENISGLRKLEYLDLCGNKIRKINFQYLSGLNYSLKELWLRDNDLKYINSEINVLESLEVLNLGSNNIRDIDSGVSLARLRELVLDGNELRRVPELINASSRLIKLNLNNNQIESFKLTRYNRNLIELNIGDNPLIDFEVEPIKYKLEILIFDWVRLEDNWLEQFPSTLRVLSIEHCDLKSIQKLSHLNSLRELSIISNEIVTIIDMAGKLKKLNKIWIGNNEIPLDEIVELEKRYNVIY
jgi:Leucine-rich repeat (LRR) protein